MIEDAIVIGIGETEDPVGRILHLSSGGFGVPRAIGDVKGPGFIEGHVDGALNQGWPSDFFNRVTFREGEDMRVDGNLDGLGEGSQ